MSLLLPVCVERPMPRMSILQNPNAFQFLPRAYKISAALFSFFTYACLAYRILDGGLSIQNFANAFQFLFLYHNRTPIKLSDDYL